MMKKKAEYKEGQEASENLERCSEKMARHIAEKDPLLALVGSGLQLWRSEHADEYVQRLREGW